MFRLTREVRFCIQPDGRLPEIDGKNGHGGRPAVTGLAFFFALRVTLGGEPGERSGYLVNIKHVDSAVRDRAVPLVARHVANGTFGGGGGVLVELFNELKKAWPPFRLEALELSLTPTLSLDVKYSELPMIRLSQKFEFAASHRLHDVQLSDEENRALYGKCNNALGHGHNYEVQVTVEADTTAPPVDVARLEIMVDEAVIKPFDHKYLNAEVPEFADVNPSVENIAKAAHDRLKPRLAAAGVRLASVTVWETPKTWCEYGE